MTLATRLRYPANKWFLISFLLQPQIVEKKAPKQIICTATSFMLIRSLKENAFPLCQYLLLSLCTCHIFSLIILQRWIRSHICVIDVALKKLNQNVETRWTTKWDIVFLQVIYCRVNVIGFVTNWEDFHHVWTLDSPLFICLEVHCASRGQHKDNCIRELSTYPSHVP